MDVHKTEKYFCLPRTSRVTDKILEYYMKFGKERDLEKFMRLHSPNSRSRSSSGQSASTGSSEGSSGSGALKHGVIRRLFDSKLNECEGSRSESSSGGVELQKTEHIIPIVFEKNIGNNPTAKDGSTDERSIEPQSKTTIKTPDSVAKTKRMLEWDSLGDVGYMKAMSTSNVSILERSILRDFFQDSSRSSAYARRVAANASEGDLHGKLIKELFLDEIQLKKQTKAAADTTNTPPLASSTHLEKRKTVDHEKPEQCSKEDESSVRAGTYVLRQEQCVQTSLERAPTKKSQEIQVNLDEAPKISSTTTSTSVTTKTSCTSSNSDYNLLPAAAAIQEQKVSIDSGQIQKTQTSSSESKESSSGSHILVESNEINAQENKSSSLEWSNSPEHIDSDSFTEDALKANKENIVRRPTLDLGIQLLCSLIDAKSLSHREKKKLVRDIVKRITQLGIRVKELSESKSSSNSNTNKNNNKAPIDGASKLRNNDAKNQEKSDKYVPKELTVPRPPPIVATCSSDSSKDEQLMNIIVYSPDAPPATTSAKLVSKQGKTTQGNYRKEHANDINEGLLIDTKTTITETEEKPAKNSAQVKHQNLVSSASSNLSQKKTIPKTLDPKICSSDSDATMNEWLNPMTQSELEYEERRKRDEAGKQLLKEKKENAKKNSANTDVERAVQLNWIETEIHRLESLKNLLIKENINTVGGNKSSTDKRGRHKKMEEEEEKGKDVLYDPVYPETVEKQTNSNSASSCESSKQLCQEIEVIIEESNEDLINFENKLKRTKERKRETQIVYDKPSIDASAMPTGKALFRTMKETVTTHEEQVLSNESGDKAPPQRSKIDTPCDSTESSESVCSFVQQRKREFIEHYNKKKRDACATFVQQKKDEQQQQEQQELYRCRNNAANSKCTQVTSNGLYSVPNTMSHNYGLTRMHPQYMYPQRHFAQPQLQQFWQQYSIPNTAAVSLPPPPPPPASAPPPPPPTASKSHKRTHVQYTTSAGVTSVYTSNKNSSSNTHSSSSMFAISSEISIPMGSNSTTSTTTTTTHQYDDVAAGGASLPSSSDYILYARNKCGTAPQMQLPPSGIGAQRRPPTADIHLRPKSIAYVITFGAAKAEKRATAATTTEAPKPTAPKSTAPTTATTTSTKTTTSQQTTDTSEPPLTLQQHLQLAKPKFCADSKERKAILNKMQALRQQRECELRNIVENTSMRSLDRKLMALPPPPTKLTRVVSTKEMKAMTGKNYARLPEILDKQRNEREERRRRGNRIIRDVFNKRLQKLVRSGKLSLNHSRTVI